MYYAAAAVFVAASLVSSEVFYNSVVTGRRWLVSAVWGSSVVAMALVGMASLAAALSL
jgi:steroid 5-alpha reductase family enzyme